MSKNRFYIPDKFFRVVQKKNMLAFFSFVDNETGLEYHNWRLMQGSNGTFVGSPFETYNEKFYDQVRVAYDGTRDDKRSPKGVAFMKELHDAVYAVFDKKRSASGESAPDTGRGPVADSSDEDDDLPF